MGRLRITVIPYLNERYKREPDSYRPPKVQAFYSYANLSGKQIVSGQDSEADSNRCILCGGGLKMSMLITNNTDLSQHISSCRFIDGSSLDVLVCVRSLVQSGSRLLTHPLCGNLRPDHQPYRSVIVDENTGSVDLDSLTIIENAVRIYQSCKILIPDEIDELTRKDYAYIDSELMRASLEQYGLITKEGY